ncbi:phosphatidylserine synthase 2-like [Symsagittifera roscoffensis]|uniref:phosphatidylserine synthase 2-like n=1 Tax=Symsagittifera roscoffensis TaxID=84072 RepID=UPI00307B6668
MTPHAAKFDTPRRRGRSPTSSPDKSSDDASPSKDFRRSHSVCIAPTKDGKQHSRNIEKIVFSDDGKVKFYDDGNLSIAPLWSYHTFSVLVVMISILVYEAFFVSVNDDTSYNVRRGVLAGAIGYICYGLTQCDSGPFQRPHPAFWRFFVCVSLLYELGVIFILFQNIDDARSLVWELDSSLGQPLEEQSYGGSCDLWDPTLDDPMGNFWGKCDVFILAHVAAWWAKMMIVRSVWLCMTMSFLFECLEYSLEHQLPNFAECWWDHWILDFVVCNGLGIWLGGVCLKYLNAKNYHWRTLWSIPSMKGKISRVFLQFTPYYWTEFHWNPFLSIQRYVSLTAVVWLFLIAEVNSFYLKTLFWIPPPHWLNITRLIILSFAAASSCAEYYAFTTNAKCVKIGHQAWILIAIVATEVLVVCKFSKNVITLPPPSYIILFWSIVISCWLAYAVHQFIVPAIAKVLARRSLYFNKGSKMTTATD